MTAEESKAFQVIVNKVDRVRASSEDIEAYGKAHGVETKPIGRALALTIDDADFLINLVRREEAR